MGSKTSLLVYAEGDPKLVLRTRPTLDRPRARRMLDALFPNLAGGDPIVAETNLGEALFPDERIVCAASFAGLDIITNRDVQIDEPSRLAPELVRASEGRWLYLHAMSSVTDWFAFGVWRDGHLVRSLSVSPDDGPIENIGEPLPIELPFWAGEHPPVDPDSDDEYPLPFHPCELGEHVLASLLGSYLEGESPEPDPMEIPLGAFLRR